MLNKYKKIQIAILIILMFAFPLQASEKKKKDLKKSSNKITKKIQKIQKNIETLEKIERTVKDVKEIARVVKEKRALIKEKGILEAVKQEIEAYLSNKKDEITEKVQNYINNSLENFFDGLDRDKKVDYYAGIEYSFLDRMVLGGSGLIPRQGMPYLRFGVGAMDFSRLEIRYPLSSMTCDVEEGHAISWDDGANSYEQLNCSWGSLNFKFIKHVNNDIMPYIHIGLQMSEFTRDEQNSISMFGTSYGLGIDVRLLKYFMLELNYTGTYQVSGAGTAGGEFLGPDTNDLSLISHSLNVGLFLNIQISTEKVDKFFNIDNR